MTAATDLEVTTGEAAAVLEISAERIRQLIKSGHIPAQVHGRISLVAAVQGYIRFLKDEARRSSKSASASRYQDAKAKEVELKIAERDGRLIDLVEHRDLFAEILGTLRDGFAGLPAQLTRDMAFRGKIETAIDDVLRRAADSFEQASSGVVPGGVPAPADNGDDA